MTATDPEREAGRAAAHRATVLALLLTIAAPPQARGDVCFGDCTGRFGVGADDLRAGVGALFDPQPSDGCVAAFDGNGDGRVVAADLVAAARAAQSGCGERISACAVLTEPLQIPDDAADGTVSTIAVADAVPAEALSVTLRITHGWVGDLRAWLTHVDTGTSVILLDRPGVPASLVGCGVDDVDCALVDDASLAAEDQCAADPPAIRGELRPAEALTAFTSESLAGTWQLTVADLASRDSGSLQAWCLTSAAALRPTPTRPPSPTAGTPTGTATRTGTAAATPTASRTTGLPTPSTPTPTHPSPPLSPSVTRTATRSAAPAASATPTNPPNNTVDLEAGGRVATGAGAVIEVLPGSGQGLVTLSATASGAPGATDERGVVVSREYDVVAIGPAAAQLAGPLITLPVDVAVAGGAIDPYAFLAETFDAAAGGWVGVDGMPRFDRGTTSVIFQAPHLSKFRLRYAGLGVDFYFQYEATSPRGHFLIKYYCPTAVTCVLPPASSPGVTNYFPFADADWQPVSGGHASDADVPDYVEDLAQALEDGLDFLLALRTSGGGALFTAPAYPLQVRVTYTPDANGDSPLGGPPRIRARLDDWNEMRTTAPHELVHVLTDQYYTTLGAYLNRWFFEAIANLWAARAAGLTRPEQVTFFSRDMSNYLRVPLTQSDEGSYYAAADFLAWLEAQLGAPLAADVVHADYTRDIAGLAALISASHGTTLDTLFFEYARLATVGDHDLKPKRLFELDAGQFSQVLSPGQRGWRYQFNQFGHSVRAVHLRSTIATPGMLVAVAERTLSDQQRGLTTFSYAGASLGPVADIDDYLEATSAAGDPVVVKHFGAPNVPGVVATLFDQVVVTGERYRPVDEGPHVFDFYVLEAPLVTSPSMGRIDWTFDGSGIPSPGLLQTPYVAGFNVYSRGGRLNDELIDADARRYDDARLLAGCDARATVEDRFGNEWPDPPQLLLAAPTGSVTCCGQGAACRLAPCATGGGLPHQWTLVSGALPPGFLLDATTGEVSGTVGSDEREFPYRLQVADPSGATAFFDGSVQHCGDFQGFLCTLLCLL